MFARILGTYSSLLDKRPLVTKSVSAGILFSLGDAVTQLSTNVIIKRLRKTKSSTGIEI